jgi:RNA polymerase sigma-70 factor (ECF subfamily)
MTWDPDTFQKESAFVRALARDLVVGAADVDDLVQETWLRALLRPARAGFSPRAWLAGLVRNVARERRRADARRERRELDTRSPSPTSSSDDPAALAQRFELVRQLFAAIDQLAEPQRTALLMRYLDGLEPVEIARRLQLPDATVRSRIKRGLDELRARLDAQRGGDRSAWASVLLPLAMPAELGTVAATPTNCATPTLHSATAKTGGLLVKTSTALVATGLVVGGVFLAAVAIHAFLARHDELGDSGRRSAALDSTRDTTLAPPAVAEVAPRDTPREAVRTAAEPSRPADSAAESAPPREPAEWRIEGVVRGVSSSRPIQGRLVVAAVPPIGPHEPEPSKLEVALEPTGEFSAPLPGFATLGRSESSPWRGLLATFSDPDYVDVQQFVATLDEHGRPCAAPHTFHVELTTRASSRVHGRVVDEEGRALGGVRVAWERSDFADGEPLATSDRAGRFTLEAKVHGSARLRASARDPEYDDLQQSPTDELADLLSASCDVDLSEGGDALAPDLVMKHGVAIRGTVVDGGVVVGGARLSATRDDATAPSIAQVACDDAGRFALRGLVAGRWKLGVVGIDGVPTHPLVGEGPRGDALDVDAPSDGVVVECRLCRVELRLELDGTPQPRRAISITATSRDGRNSSVLGGRSDDDGRFRFLALPGCSHHVSIDDARDVERETPPFLLTEDERTRVVTLRLEHRRARPSLVVKLRDRGDATVGRAWFELTKRATSAESDRSSRRDFALVPKDGAFVIEELELGDYHVVVRPGGGHFGTGGFYCEESFDVAWTEPARVERTVDVRPTGRLRVFVHDRDGHGVRARCEIGPIDGPRVDASFTTEGDAVTWTQLTNSVGPALLTSPPAAGHWRLVFTASGYVSRSVDVDVVLGETRDVDVELVPG